MTVETRLDKAEREISKIWSVLESLKDGQNEIAKTLSDMAGDIRHLAQYVQTLTEKGTFRCVEHAAALKELCDTMIRNREEAVGYTKRVEAAFSEHRAGCVKICKGFDQRLDEFSVWRSKVIGITIGLSSVSFILSVAAFIMRWL